MNSKSTSVIFKSKLALLSFAILIPLHSQAAGTSTTVMSVSATVLTACTVAATPLVFGNYDTTATNLDADASITVLCTGNTSYALALGKGLDASATFATRKLLSATGTEVIDYSIYTDDTHTTVWGDGSAGTSTVSGTGVLGTKSHTVYGRMPAGQSANQGIYADIINVTLTY